MRHGRYALAELKRLARVKYEERKEGFSCESCKYLKELDYCAHPKVLALVKTYGCCTEWSGHSDYKAEV